jgi:hypothetical protein
MTTLENRPNTALLVVDVQNGVVGGAHERDAVVANVGSLVEKARREQIAVVWVQHSDGHLARGSDDWRIVPELTPGDAEPLVGKSYGDAFEDTTLETVLSGLGVGRLVVVGAETDACIRSTLHGAFVRGYDASLVSDAHTTGDKTAWGAPPPDQVIAHTNLYWTYTTAPGRTAGTVETKGVDFAGALSGRGDTYVPAAAGDAAALMRWPGSSGCALVFRGAFGLTGEFWGRSCTKNSPGAQILPSTAHHGTLAHHGEHRYPSSAPKVIARHHGRHPTDTCLPNGARRCLPSGVGSPPP